MAKHIAVIDKTGRGHSICQALITTNNDVTVHYIPGTAGIFDKRILTVPSISLKDTKAIDEYCQKQGIELIVVSHIDALKADVSTSLRSRGYAVFGPSSEATKLETSKSFCKSVCVATDPRPPVFSYLKPQFLGISDEILKAFSSNPVREIKRLSRASDSRIFNSSICLELIGVDNVFPRIYIHNC